MSATVVQPPTDLVVRDEKALATDADRPATAPQELTTVLDIMARIFQAI